MRLSAHLPRHRSLHSCTPCAAPCGQLFVGRTRFRVACRSGHSVTEAATTFESRRGKGKGCASSRNFRALTPCGRSGTEAGLFFQNLFLFSGVETPLSVPPRWLLSLVKAIWGNCLKGSFQLQRKKLRGSGWIKGDGESLGCQVKGTVNNCGGFR